MNYDAEYGNSIVTTQPRSWGPLQQDSATAVPLAGPRDPGPRPGDWNVDTPPIWTYLIAWITTAQGVQNNRALFKLMKQRKWRDCQCWQFCSSHAFLGVKLSIDGGSASDVSSLESGMSQAIKKRLENAPKLKSGEAGDCGTVLGGECGDRCGFEYVEDKYRIPVSGQVRLAGGGVATFIGFIFMKGTLMAILYKGLPPFPGEPHDPELPPYGLTPHWSESEERPAVPYTQSARSARNGMVHFAGEVGDAGSVHAPRLGYQPSGRAIATPSSRCGCDPNMGSCAC